MKRMLIAITLACVISGTAMAGEMPGVDLRVVGEMPTVPSTGEANTPPVPGDMPGVDSVSYSGTDESLVTTVLLTLITTLLGR
ncbi:MAG TPA: hypothetical protein VFS76_20395 [Pyrinomonadaceae bacterium]|nr:hypothetical protein [Pyrinomonadaceae bacterium]